MRRERGADVLYYLADSHSFLKAEYDWELKNHQLNSQAAFISLVVGNRSFDTIHGVYVNAVEDLDCLIFTGSGIHTIYSDREKFVSYVSIASVSPPSSSDRELDIELVTGEYVTVSVHGSTNEVPDIFAVYEFLDGILVPRGDVYSKLKDVDSEDSLNALMNENYGFIDWMKDLPDLMGELEIDPKIFEMKGIWRLIGLLRIRLEEQNSD